jgi:hypothetical protein
MKIQENLSIYQKFLESSSKKFFASHSHKKIIKTMETDSGEKWEN